MPMKNCRFLLFVSLLVMLNSVGIAQNASTAGDGYKVKIGNIGFALDSIDFQLGTVMTGKVFEKEIGVTNLGKKNIGFLNTKQQPYLDVSVMPATLAPGSTGKIIMKFNPDLCYKIGKFDAEVTMQTDDPVNAYKFLYFSAYIVDDTVSKFGYGLIDSVPRLVFDQLNYSFGDLSHAKSMEYNFTFTNLGAEELVIDSLSASKGCKVVAFPKKVYSPGETGSVTIKISTLYSYGVQHRWVKIFSNDPRNPMIILGTHGSVYYKGEKNRDSGFCYE